MSLIIRLIAQYALWIYILCALGMIFYLRAALSARHEGSQAIFSLERDTAAKRVYRSSGMIIMLLAIVVGVYTLSHYPVPESETSPIQISTPTVEATLSTKPTSPTTPGAPTATSEPTATRRPRVTTVVLPTIVQETPTVQVLAPQCPYPNVQIAQPGQNQVINAGIQARGTASKETFDRYEFKFRRSDVQDEWHWVQTFRTPVQNGDLGWWQTSHLPNGTYRFMLIAIDKTGNSQECTVPVVVQH